MSSRPHCSCSIYLQIDIDLFIFFHASFAQFLGEADSPGRASRPTTDRGEQAKLNNKPEPPKLLSGRLSAFVVLQRRQPLVSMMRLRICLWLAFLLLCPWQCLGYVQQQAKTSSSFFGRGCLTLRSYPSSTLEMKIRVGIVGLPNVGKSTLFNALAKRSLAQASNFPFCTIDPNIAPISIPDPYLQPLGKLADCKRTVPATIDWIDVAGLTKGASRGEGLGNKFLATIRECDAICHVVRNYEDGSIVHVEGKVDPLADAEVVNLELLLADLAHVERRLDKSSCQGEERDALERVSKRLEEGMPARSARLSESEAFAIKSMGLLTLKPVIYAFNVDEVDFFFDREDAIKEAEQIVTSLQYSDSSALCTIVSAKVEAEISERSEEEQAEYLSSLGVELNDDEEVGDMLSYTVLPLKAMELLDLSLVYTGPGVAPERSRTTKAHVYRQQQEMTAEQLAGKLHGTIQKGFIRAEVISAPTLLDHPNLIAAKEAGCVQTEGRDYILEANDVVLIKWKE